MAKYQYRTLMSLGFVILMAIFDGSDNTLLLYVSGVFALFWAALALFSADPSSSDPRSDSEIWSDHHPMSRYDDWREELEQKDKDH